MQMLSGPGIGVLVLTVTFASVDWAMSLNPEWFSTIYGLLFVAAWALSALAFVIAVMAFLVRRETALVAWCGRITFRIWAN